jgi:hypothetical protein
VTGGAEEPKSSTLIRHAVEMTVFQSANEEIGCRIPTVWLEANTDREEVERTEAHDLYPA